MATGLDKYRDIFDKKAFCHIATVGRDGRPQVTPVWCDFDGTHVRINTARGRIKDRNLKTNPNVALSVQDPDNPYRYVQVRGRVAEMTEQGADAHIDALAKKYPYRVSGKNERFSPSSEIFLPEAPEKPAATAPACSSRSAHTKPPAPPAAFPTQARTVSHLLRLSP